MCVREVIGVLIEFAQSLLDVLFPPRCVRCRRAGAVLCAACLATAHAPNPPLCPRCGRSLLAGHVDCPTCAAGHGPTALRSLRAAALHDGAVRDAVLALKYRGQRRLAAPLATVLERAVRESGNLPDVIVPVPLHAGRRRQRGYNQAELLARSLARRLGVPCETKALVRHRATPPQVGLSSPERRANVAGAFALASPAAARCVAGQRVLLIDDVTTTGSTLDAAAAALLVAAPAEVRGLALTRPDLSDDRRDASWVASGRSSVATARAAEIRRRP